LLDFVCLIAVLCVVFGVNPGAGLASGTAASSGAGHASGAGPASHDDVSSSAEHTVQAEPDTAVWDTLFWGPEIVVEAKRITPEDELAGGSGFVAMIDLGRRKDRIEDIASILSRTIGVRVKQYGGLGGYATMSIRGSSSSQVQFYLDGVPISDAYTGTTDLSNLALGDIKRIEVFRGSSPVGFGSSSIGGTVNLVPRDFGDRDDLGAIPSVETRASAGSFGTENYHLTLDSQIGRLMLRCHGGYLGSGGDFRFLDDNATPENLLDDTEVARSNNDFGRWNVSGRVGLDLPGFQAVSLNYDAIDRESGVPGLGSNQSTTARCERKRRIGYLKLEPGTLLSHRLHARAAAYYSWTAERFSDPMGEISPSRQETDNRIKAYGMNVRTKLYAPVLPLAIEAFVEGRKDRFHPVSLVPRYSAGPDRLRTSRILSVAGDLSLLSDRVILTAGTRHEWHENEFYDEPFMPWLPPTPQGRAKKTERTPSFGFRLHPAACVVLKGNWGRHYRVPTFFELFGNRGSVTGDSGLENENGENFDVGIVFSAERFWRFDNPFLEVVYLNNDVENLILFFPNSQHTVKPRNIGSASIEGCELSASLGMPGSIVLSANYSYLRGKDTSPIPYYTGNDLPGRPAHEAFASLTLLKRRWDASYELHFIGSNYLDRANMEEVSARTLHNLIIGLKLPRHGMSLSLEGCNLGDDRTQDVSGFPLPGRSFYITARWKR
jgi:iron complex outermembrane receptor protein